MTDKIKSPASASLPSNLVSETTQQQTKTVKASSAGENEIVADGYQKVAQGMLGYKSSPLMSGAYKIFTDGIVFPPHLLDTKDPTNDTKYLRLLAAIFGIDEMEKYFLTMSEEKEEERKIKRKEKYGSEEEKEEEK
ncbi:MAG: hypothetical protein JNK65_00305 [Deltaproteobacteria bacterium]|nr:hypothetical protein [Deltaproteobacteria bacterium]